MLLHGRACDVCNGTAALPSCRAGLALAILAADATQAASYAAVKPPPANLTDGRLHTGLAASASVAVAATTLAIAAASGKCLSAIIAGLASVPSLLQQGSRGLRLCRLG